MNLYYNIPILYVYRLNQQQSSKSPFYNKHFFFFIVKNKVKHRVMQVKGDCSDIE